MKTDFKPSDKKCFNALGHLPSKGILHIYPIPSNSVSCFTCTSNSTYDSRFSLQRVPYTIQMETHRTLIDQFLEYMQAF